MKFCRLSREKTRIRRSRLKTGRTNRKHLGIAQLMSRWLGHVFNLLIYRGREQNGQRRESENKDWRDAENRVREAGNGNLWPPCSPQLYLMRIKPQRSIGFLYYFWKWRRHKTWQFLVNDINNNNNIFIFFIKNTNIITYFSIYLIYVISEIR